MTLQTPDVLVIGAGTAGAAAAAHLAEAGREVVLADRQPAEAAGACWVNAIPGWLFDEAAIPRPQPPELERDGTAHRSVLADGHGRFCDVVDPDPGLHVHMAPLTRRLQRRAFDSGATFLQGRVTGVTLTAGRLDSVILATDDHQTTLRPRLAIDASGAAATLRRRVPTLADGCPTPLPTDMCLAAQYQHRITDPAGARAFLDTNRFAPEDNFTRTGIVGGYSILMLTVNEELTEVGVLSGSIPADGVPSGRAIVDRFVAETPWVGERLTGGQAPIPLGQPHTHLTAPGVALVGNAANHVYALHGSGVGMGLVAARHLAEAAMVSDDPGDPHALHGYAHGFLTTYGGRLAASDLFRRYSQTLDADEIAELLGSHIVGGPMLASGLTQRPFKGDLQSLVTILSGTLRHPWLALQVAPVALRMVTLQAAFADYPDRPDPSALRAFDARLRRLRGF